MALVGPSGCGKSTLLRVVAGLAPADRGEIRIGGDVVDDGVRRVEPEHRRTGLVFQEHALFPHLTVADNIAFGLRDLSRVGTGRARRPLAQRDRPRSARRPLPARAVRRRAPARRPGPRARPRTAARAARRALRQPRPEPADPAAGRHRRDPPVHRHAGAVRDPRSGGGPVDRRPGGRDARGTDRTGRPARRRVPPSGQPVRGRASSTRPPSSPSPAARPSSGTSRSRPTTASSCSDPTTWPSRSPSTAGAPMPR